MGGLGGWGEVAVGWGRAGGKVGFNGLNVQILFWVSCTVSQGLP